MKTLVHLLHEVGMLSKTPRSGFAFLGSGKQSVAEHSYRMTLVAFVLAKHFEEMLDVHKLLLICLLHDLPEARTGDLNYVNKKYVKADEDKILNEIEHSSLIGSEIAAYIRDYKENGTLEARIAHDADQLELILCLKEEHDKGNPQALDWYQNSIKRLKTEPAKLLAEEIWATDSFEWWLKNKEDPHWINGGGQL